MSKSVDTPNKTPSKKINELSIVKSPYFKRTIDNVRAQRTPDEENESPEKRSAKKVKIIDENESTKFLSQFHYLTPFKIPLDKSAQTHPIAITAKPLSLDEALKALQEMTKINEQLLSDHKKLAEKVQELELKTRQVTSQKIVSTMEMILGHSKTDKALAEISFTDPDAPKLITLGRPPIIGESKVQLSHIIPYGLINKLIKSIVENEHTFNDKIDLLIEDITALFSFDEGICLSSEDLEKYKLTHKLAKKLAYLTYDTTKDTYYLIDENFEDIIPKSSERISAQKKYVEKKQKFISTVLTELKNAIHDENTKIIFCKELANFMFILFNKKTFASYPSEGNNLETEIRLYKTIKSAFAAGNDYEIITSLELKEKIDSGKSLNKKIRVVNNAGSKVKKALKALKMLGRVIN